MLLSAYNAKIVFSSPTGVASHLYNIFNEAVTENKAHLDFNSLQLLTEVMMFGLLVVVSYV